MSTPYLGEIRVVGFNFPPVGWATCNGQLLSISENEALFAVIGTTYGGDGVTTFGVPSMNSRVGIGSQGGLAGPGLSTYQQGATGGTENVTLLATQIPVHVHPYAAPLQGTTVGPATDNPAGNRPGSLAATYATAANGKNLATSAVTGVINPAGGSQPHPNISPVLALNYIICTEGIFPPRG
jgi:microcystin-dependent protein